MIRGLSLLPCRPFHCELIDQRTQKLFNISVEGAALHHQVGNALPSIWSAIK